MTDMKLYMQQLHNDVDATLARMEPWFGDNYQITLIARCVNPDISDANMVFTRDSLDEIADAVRAMASKATTPGEGED